MVDVKTDFFKMPPPVIRTSSSYQSNAPTYTAPKFKTSSAISDKSKTIDFNMSTGLMRGIPHNTLAFKPSSELIRDVESRRQVSLSPSAKQAIVKYQTEYKTKMNIQPSRNVSLVMPKNPVTINTDSVSTRIVDVPRLSGKPPVIEPATNLSGATTVKDIAGKFVRSLGQSVVDKRKEADYIKDIFTGKKKRVFAPEKVTALPMGFALRDTPLILISPPNS